MTCICFVLNLGSFLHVKDIEIPVSIQITVTMELEETSLNLKHDQERIYN